MNPSVRRTDVIVQAVDPDLLVYDQLRDVAHSLGAVAAYVYQHADGSRSVADITGGMSKALGITEDQRLTEAALWQLECAHLLEQPAALEGAARAMNRRAAVRRFGAAALAVATMSSIVAPTPAMAQSSGSSGPPVGRDKDKDRDKDKSEEKGKGKGD